MRKRFEHIDILKGILIILVVFGHAIGNVNNNDNINLDMPMAYIGNSIYRFHMHAFFFLSGCFAEGLTNKAFYQALKKLFVRLIIPYFIWTFIVYFIKALTSSLQNNTVELNDLLLSPIVPFAEFWFLYVMFFIQLIYILLNKLYGEWGKKIFFVIAFLSVLIRPFVTEVWIVDYLLRFMIFYSYGTILDKAIRKEKMADNFTFVFFLFFFLICNIISIYGISNTNTAIQFYYHSFIYASSALLFLYYIALKLSNIHDALNVKKFLGIIGKNSIIVYCIHPIIMGVIRIIMYKILGPSNVSFQIILNTLITVICCYISIYLAGKWKIDKCKLYKIVFGKSD